MWGLSEKERQTAITPARVWGPPVWSLSSRSAARFLPPSSAVRHLVLQRRRCARSHRSSLEATTQSQQVIKEPQLPLDQKRLAMHLRAGYTRAATYIFIIHQSADYKNPNKTVYISFFFSTLCQKCCYRATKSITTIIFWTISIMWHYCDNDNPYIKINK